MKGSIERCLVLTRNATTRWRECDSGVLCRFVGSLQILSIFRAICLQQNAGGNCLDVGGAAPLLTQILESRERFSIAASLGQEIREAGQIIDRCQMLAERVALLRVYRID